MTSDFNVFLYNFIFLDFCSVCIPLMGRKQVNIVEKCKCDVSFAKINTICRRLRKQKSCHLSLQDKVRFNSATH